MPVKTKPVSGQSSWGNVLNTHLEQLIPNSGGGINTFDIFTDRPIYKAGTSTPLDADDVGLTYLFTQTGNLHRWSGTQWKVLNESVINVKDYGAVGDDIGKTPQDFSIDISTATWNIWPDFMTGANIDTNDPDYTNKIDTIKGYNGWNTITPPRPKPFTNSDSWDYIGIHGTLAKYLETNKYEC